MFVSHYCNVPYHRLLNDESYEYSNSDIEELFLASVHLIRRFELAPYKQVDDMEEKLINDIKNGRI